MRIVASKDIEGLRFHHVTIGKEAPIHWMPSGQTRRKFFYKCDCGNVGTTFLHHIKRQRPKSCGCQNKNLIGAAQRTHGMADTVEFTAWKHMKARCLLKTRNDYHNYGGRGISFCARWLKFENFFEDMGKRPCGMSLDRIDVNGDYCKENCRWATPRQQANNTRTNHWVTAQGRTQTTAMWAHELGMKPDTLRHRLRKGMTPERAVSCRNLRHKGVTVYAEMIRVPSGKRVARYSL